MRHFSQAALQRLSSLGHAVPLTEGDIVNLLRVRLKDLDRKGIPLRRAKACLAIELGVRTPELTRMLRGQMPPSDVVARKLGYRKVTRFEPIE